MWGGATGVDLTYVLLLRLLLLLALGRILRVRAVVGDCRSTALGGGEFGCQLQIDIHISY
jgi:hypothetical protein